MRTVFLVFVFWVLVALFGTIGWINNLVLFVESDFKEPYKREIVRGIGVFTGLGSIIGYINIKDGGELKKEPEVVPYKFNGH